MTTRSSYTPKKILVIGPSWVGDMVMAQSLLMTLKKTLSECQIDVMAPAWSFPLLERMPEVTYAIPMPLTHGQFNLKTRWQLAQKLHSAHYDQAIVLPNSWKSALIPYFAKIPQRTGYRGEMRWGLLNDIRPLEKLVLPMTVQRFVALGLARHAPQPPDYSIPKLTIKPDNQQAVVNKFGLASTHLVLAFCPGAEYGPAKRWPVTHFAKLAQLVIAQGGSVWLFGSKKDQFVAGEINRLSANACLDFSGQTTLAEAIDMMSLADAVVSNDSGLMHIASALNRPVIALYGSSDPGFTPPLNTSAKIINLKLDCSPCFKRVCPLGHTHCLTHITPQQVFNQLLS